MASRAPMSAAESAEKPSIIFGDAASPGKLGCAMPCPTDDATAERRARHQRRCSTGWCSDDPGCVALVAGASKAAAALARARRRMRDEFAHVLPRPRRARAGDPTSAGVLAQLCGPPRRRLATPSRPCGAASAPTPTTRCSSTSRCATAPAGWSPATARCSTGPARAPRRRGSDARRGAVDRDRKPAASETKKGGRSRPACSEPNWAARSQPSAFAGAPARGRRRWPRRRWPSAPRPVPRLPAARSRGARSRPSLPWPCGPGGRPGRYRPGSGGRR